MTRHCAFITRFRTWVVVLVCLCPCPAPPADADDAQTVTLNFWNYPSRRARGIGDQSRLAQYDFFFDNHPEIRVSRITALMAPPGQREASDMMAMAGGTAPDILDVFLRRAQSYIDQRFLYPLDEYIAQEGPGFLESLDIPPQLWPVVQRDGKTYALISDYAVQGLMYRRDLMLEAGLDPNRSPATWDELFRYAQRLTFPEKSLRRSSLETGARTGQWGIGVVTGFYGGWTFTNYIWQAGGDMVHWVRRCPSTGKLLEGPKEAIVDRCPDTGELLTEKNSPIRWKAVYDSPAGIEALRFLRRLRWHRWQRDPLTGGIADAPEAICPRCGNVVWFTEPKTVQRCPIAGCGASVEISEASLEVVGADGTPIRWDRPFIKGVCSSSGDLALMGGAILQGRIAMAVGILSQEFLSGAESEGLNPMVIGFGGLPAGPHGHKAHFISGAAWGINATQKDARVRNAAWQFIKFLCSDQAKRIHTEVFVRKGKGGLVNPNLLRKFGYTEYLDEVPDSFVQAYEEAQRFGRVEPWVKGYVNVQTSELAVPLDKVMTEESADPAVLMRESAHRVNEQIFGIKPPEELKRRQIIGWIVVAAGAVLFVYMFWCVIRELSEKHGISASTPGQKLTARKHIMAWTFLLPALLSILVWQYIPLIRGSYMAFFDYKLLGGSTFVGIGNFVELLFDRLFWQTVYNTIIYVFLSLSIGFAIPIVLAILLSEVPRGKMLFRTLYYLPAVTTGLVIMFLWKDLIFAPERTGLFNRLWLMLPIEGLEPINWLEQPSLAMLCVILPGVWAGAGPGSIIYIAALKTVPSDYYEAAELDGASWVSKIRHVTLPMLAPLILINFIGAFIGSFHAAQNVFVMTGGGPANSTRLVGLEIWYNAFLYLRYGYATAMAWVLGATLIGFTIYQLRILKRVEFTAAGRSEE